MTGFDSKRQMAMDELVATQEALGMYDDQKPQRPQRPWVGLTDEEISDASKGYIVRSTYARAIEAVLKEKNFD